MPLGLPLDESQEFPNLPRHVVYMGLVGFPLVHEVQVFHLLT